MPRTYQTTVTVVVDDDSELGLDDLRTYLANATMLDIDTEEHGSAGVDSISIAWDNLTESKDGIQIPPG